METKNATETDREKIQKRLELMRTSKLRDKSRIASAMEKQDSIRKKAGRGKSLTSRIRKWRDSEHALGS
ncbi:hypothetical protein AKJ36_02350 [candidate division MSBL1 archaeon SCGC-AAA259I07]|uniref:Uncharacterized protein n=1 Tax=candidate division MSBL1 archaeon SCGC-AAA259I07 TaxID=1698266 RepID=A0A133UKK0_9EURY|nr:hypothetical protein AKJ36_02350 [candidate division MSBL1 archaeon SCGC-AAA259I07]